MPKTLSSLLDLALTCLLAVCPPALNAYLLARERAEAAELHRLEAVASVRRAARRRP